MKTKRERTRQSEKERNEASKNGKNVKERDNNDKQLDRARKNEAKTERHNALRS